MNKLNKASYLAPEVEVTEMSVERGFGDSLGGYDPDPTKPGENPALPDEDDEW